jgi:peptidyl-prolyl cis-trans isomerase A (cyclophilin A)
MIIDHVRRAVPYLALGLLAAACTTKSSEPKKEAADKAEAEAEAKDKAKAKHAPSETAPAAARQGREKPDTGGGPAPITLEEATDGLDGDGPLTAEISTDLGAITCKLLPDVAPETVASFVGLARGKRALRDPKSGEWVKRPFFDGLLFHRVLPEFMIQGGDPLSIDHSSPALGTGGPGYTLPDELSPAHKFDHGGVLAMANKGPRTHSGGSQFFITEGPTPQLNGGYVIFGDCEGVDVVKKIARVPRGAADRPDTPVPMKVTIKRG